MYSTIHGEKQDVSRAGSYLLLGAIAVLLLLCLALLLSIYQPEWLNFLWLSVATVVSAAVAGWFIGRLLDFLLEDEG